ncbi:MAG: hypothetical protein C0P74_001640 [Gammaproteobacteria bacterium]|nr:hypothetical protein [Gammaproteobacteria bacterium]
MNVRFANQAVRCRVKRAELASLLSGRALTLEVSLPREQFFRFSVRPSSLSQWQLEADPTGYWLTIPVEALRALSESLPSREGLRHAFETANGTTVEVSFEVDVKDRK